MPKSTARRTRHTVHPPSPEEPRLIILDNPKTLQLRSVVKSMPRQATKSPIEESATRIRAATPELSNIKASSESERPLDTNHNGPHAIQQDCPTNTIARDPKSAVPPSSLGENIRAAAEARIEQEEIEFRAVEESIGAEVSRLQKLIAVQKKILTEAREKRNSVIEMARMVIEGKDDALLEPRETIGTAASLNNTPAVDSETRFHHSYSISPIPPELLLPIFAMVDMEWTPLRLVCKQWNLIILNTGHFWNDIVLTNRPNSANPGVYGYTPWQPRQQLCRSLSAVQQALKLSKSSPLSISIDFLDFAGKPPDVDNFGETSFGCGPQRMRRRQDAVNLVGNEISRIRTLSVFATGGIRSDSVQHSFEPERAVMLEKLYIKGRMYDSSAEDMRFSQLVFAPNLRILRFLDRWTGHLAEVDWSSLVEISVSSLFMDWGATVTPLTLPNLRILRLSNWALDTLRKLRTPCLDSLVIHDATEFLGSFISPPVDVGSVTSLYLWYNFSILDVLNIPTVTHIELQSVRDNRQEIDTKWIETIFKGAETRFPNLTSLVLCTFTISGSISKGLTHLPHLVDLCVDAEHRKLAGVFWTDLSRTVTRRGQTRIPRILPNLKRLHVRLHQERTSAIEELATKTRVSRVVSGRPLNLLVLEWKDGGTSTIVRNQVNPVPFPRHCLSFPE